MLLVKCFNIQSISVKDSSEDTYLDYESNSQQWLAGSRGPSVNPELFNFFTKNFLLALKLTSSPQFALKN